MSEGFVVKPLKCSHCGHELPVMGQFVTFRCETCMRYWVLSPEGLRPITVYRVLLPEPVEEEPIYLPFWVIEVDKANFRRHLEQKLEGLRITVQTIVTTTPQADEDEFGLSAIEEPELDRGLVKARFVSEAGRAQKVLSSSDTYQLFSRLEGTAPYFIFVPAFLSQNTYAYLKVGRLLTRAQPVFHVEKSSGLGKPVLCALQAEEAVALVDFIFFATLPDSIQSNGDFLKEVHVQRAGNPGLAEFPFLHRGASLLSLIGGFSISSRLVEGLERPERETASSKS